MMTSQIRVIKKDHENRSKPPAIGNQTKTERQRNREMVAVVKSWIEELQLRRRPIVVPAAGSSK